MGPRTGKNLLGASEKFISFTAHEEEAYRLGSFLVVGLDEVGRGALAGPVVAAACFIPRGLFFPGINDSKKLSPLQRERLYEQIASCSAVKYGIGSVDPEVIDKVNILRASLQAMVYAVQSLPDSPDFLLVDGRHLPPINIPGSAIVKGDTISQSIMAASLLAKVTRDRMMLEQHKLWPEYRFDLHKGYPTQLHLEALKKRGASPIHRKSYAPVRLAIGDVY